LARDSEGVVLRALGLRDALWWLGSQAGSSKLVTANDAIFVDAFLGGMEDFLEEHGVVLTPLVVLRVDDVLMCYLIVRHLERELHREGAVPAACEGDEDPPDSNRRVAAAVAAMNPALEQAAKGRERMRKAMKDLEDACAKAGTPVTGGIADRVKPLMEMAEGVFEDAYHYEKERVKAKDRKAKKAG
jgi:hypothetical protein